MDYDIALSFEGEGPEGGAVWDFTLTAKPDAPVVWGHIEYRVRQNDLMPLRATFHDEEGVLARTMEFRGFREFDGRLIPSVIHVRPADKPDEHTTIRYEELGFDIDIAEPFFSLRNVPRDRRGEPCRRRCGDVPAHGLVAHRAAQSGMALREHHARRRSDDPEPACRL